MNTLNVHDTLLRWIDEAEYLAQLNIAQGDVQGRSAAHAHRMYAKKIQILADKLMAEGIEQETTDADYKQPNTNWSY